MAQPERDSLLDHEYDGIREFDNPCPGWWHLVFFGTFVFSVAYFFFFHVGGSGWTLADGYQVAVDADIKLRLSEVGELAGDEATLLKVMGKPDWLRMGEATYKTNCKSCHGENGIGAVGPNLTDQRYKNVKTLEGMIGVVENGAGDGSMPSWKNRLHPTEIVLVAAYAASLRGQNLPGPRPPEGEIIPPWPEK